MVEWRRCSLSNALPSSSFSSLHFTSVSETIPLIMLFFPSTFIQPFTAVPPLVTAVSYAVNIQIEICQPTNVISPIRWNCQNRRSCECFLQTTMFSTNCPRSSRSRCWCPPPIFPRLRHRNLWPKTLCYLNLFQSPLFLNFADFFALPRFQNMLMVTLVVPAPPSPPGFRVSVIKQLDKQWLFPRIELAQLSGCHGSEKIWQINDEAVF